MMAAASKSNSKTIINIVMSKHHSWSLQNAINFDDYHDAKIESNIDYILFEKNALNQRIQYWKPFVVNWTT